MLGEGASAGRQPRLVQARGIATFFKISYNTVQRILSISRRTLTENIKHAKNKQKLNKTKAIQRNTKSKWEKKQGASMLQGTLATDYVNDHGVGAESI